MAPSCCIELTRPERRTLLATARDALVHGLRSSEPSRPQLESATPGLHQPAAVFVTLHRANRLRGCIGSLEASDPLLWAVAHAAHGAGFRDPRFDALRAEELQEVVVEISVLSPMEALSVTNRAELFANLRPDRDGLLMQKGTRKATFLPKVWEALPDRDAFLDQLFLKAGLPAKHWSGELKFFRYETLTFDEDDYPA